MTKEKQTAARSGAQSCTCCSIESVVTLDERGWCALPKDIRTLLKRVFGNGELVDRKPVEDGIFDI